MPDSFVDALQAERSRLLAERARIDGQLSGLDTALRLYQGQGKAGSPSPAAQAGSLFDRGTPRAQEGTIKDYVFGIIGSVPEGLASGEVLAEAERQGRSLNKNTVTSLLSASASKGLLELVNGRYRIPQGIPEALGASGDVNPEPSAEAEEAARKEGGI